MVLSSLYHGDVQFDEEGMNVGVSPSMGEPANRRAAVDTAISGIYNHGYLIEHITKDLVHARVRALLYAAARFALARLGAA